MTKRIVLCADDFGQAQAISEGIIQLVSADRLSAVSCMVTQSDCKKSAQSLLSYREKIDIGLHFNLSEGAPLSNAFEARYGKRFPALSRVMLMALLRRYNQGVIEAEMHAQLDQFEAIFGFLPDFIDGHQHVHQFPVIRDALLSVYGKRLPKNTYFRSVDPMLQLIDRSQIIKKTVIKLMGAKAFRRRLMQSEIPFNSSFSGIYGFNSAGSYGRYFSTFLQQIDNGGLIMVHPGLSGTQSNDPILKARVCEYNYLMSKQFIHDCEENGVIISRYI